MVTHCVQPQAKAPTALQVKEREFCSGLGVQAKNPLVLVSEGMVKCQDLAPVQWRLIWRPICCCDWAVKAE